jgi:hypothetical protein
MNKVWNYAGLAIIVIAAILFPIKYLESLANNAKNSVIEYTSYNEVAVLRNT